MAPATRMTQLCQLDHRDPANWRYKPDRYNREDFRLVECKAFGKCYGYQRIESKK